LQRASAGREQRNQQPCAHEFPLAVSVVTRAALF
jgi:hypothetical protein